MKRNTKHSGITENGKCAPIKYIKYITKSFQYCFSLMKFETMEEISAIPKYFLGNSKWSESKQFWSVLSGYLLWKHIVEFLLVQVFFSCLQKTNNTAVLTMEYFIKCAINFVLT